MFAFIMYVYLVNLSGRPHPPRCEEHGPRLDGTRVTICDGAVVRVRDGLGNIREWERGADTVTLRSMGSPPVVLARDHH
jgi:hypothetical protein